jgi:D-alanyl-D-alanine endopeptidase (penicillin-binding protein 7)
MKGFSLLCCLLATLGSMQLAADDSPHQLALAKVDPDTQRINEQSPWSQLNPKKLKLRSASALIVDEHGNDIYTKADDKPRPIASITKLMTAMVILDASLPLSEKITITKEDRDLLRLTGSRLKYGATLTRENLLKVALMASDNRAARALARTYPGGEEAFVRAMNRKADALDMQDSHFTGPAGLDAGNVATARDVAKMARAAHTYALIREATTSRAITVRPYKGKGPLRFGNTNLSKTGYINEAGRCLVMEAKVAGQPMVIVLLNSFGKLTPFGDSNRLRKWIENGIEG